MSLYFAHKPNTRTEQSVSASVRNRGLALLKARPWDVSVATVVISNQPAYASYTKNLPYFMKATADQSNILISSHFPALPTTFAKSINWKLPALIYDYGVRLRDRTIEELKAHSGPLVEQRSKNQTFVMKEPTPELIKSLMAMDPKPLTNTRHVLQTVNLDAMKVVLFLERLTSGFLLTHTYPAFRTIDDLNPSTGEERTTPVLKKRKLNTQRYFDCVRDPESLTVDLTSEELEALSAGTLEDVSTIQLHVAKPSSAPTNEPWGPIDSLPNAEGLYFPYVKDLSVSDSVTVPFVVQQYFLKSLGPNLASASKSLNQVKSAWGLIKDTELGHEMSHLYKCIHVALECQAAVYPIYTYGIYEGCVIWGSGYAVGIGEKVYKPLSYTALQGIVQDTSMHSKAVNEIKGLVTIDFHERIDECTSIRQLANVVKEVELDELSKSKVMEAAHRLCYPNKYWSGKQSYIKQALNMILQWREPEDISTDVPMHPSMIFSIRREEVVLSAFGHQAPSFLIPNGRKLELKQGTDPPTHLLVRMVGLKEAVLDMEYVIQNGTITNNNHNLSAKHKDSGMHGNDKKEVWSKLCEIAGASNPSERDAAVVGGVDIVDAKGIDFDW